MGVIARIAVMAVLTASSCAPTLPPPTMRSPYGVVRIASGECGLARVRMLPGGPELCVGDGLLELDPAVVWWVIGHEYCHARDPFAGELETDCCAWRWVTSSLGFNAVELARVVATVQTFKTSDIHPSGAARAVGLLECDEAIP